MQGGGMSDPVQLGWVARVFLAVVALCFLSVRFKGDTAVEALVGAVIACFAFALAATLAITAAVGRFPWW